MAARGSTVASRTRRSSAIQIGVRKTRPYRPQTNGKAERFIRTLLERWAYAYPYTHETQRAALLPTAIDSYNRFRPHRALGGQTPLQRVNNLSGTNS
jgi:transposase InsO family protein